MLVNVSSGQIFEGLSKGIWGGLSLIFGLLWVIFKLTWWIWAILIILYLVRFFVFPMSRRTFFHFPRIKTFIDRNGYRRFKNSGRSIHRWVVEKELGRKLKEGEVVHHINEDKLDNSPDNLEVLPGQEEHDEIHGYDNDEDDDDED